MAKEIDDKLSYIQERLDAVASCTQNIDKELAIHKAAFDDHLKQDEKMYEEFKRMNDILQQNTNSLREHMRRTALLEEVIEKMDARLYPIEKEKLEKDAVTKYRNEQLVKIAKIVGLLTGTAGLVATMKSIWP
jgi:hypothetical protein